MVVCRCPVRPRVRLELPGAVRVDRLHGRRPRLRRGVRYFLRQVTHAVLRNHQYERVAAVNVATARIAAARRPRCQLLTAPGAREDRSRPLSKGCRVQISGVGTMGTGRYIVSSKFSTSCSRLQDLYPCTPPSQRCGLCQNFKQTTLTTGLYKVRTNLYPPPVTKTFRRAWSKWCPLPLSRFRRRIRAPSNTRFLSGARVCRPNSVSIGSFVFAGFTVVPSAHTHTDGQKHRQTDHATVF